MYGCGVYKSLTPNTMEEDLTASHWDDVLSPSQQFSQLNYAPVSNHFGNLNLDDPHRESDSDEDDNDDTEPHDEPAATYTPAYGNHNQAEMDQLNELRKEERQEHTSNLLSELTSGAQDEEEAFISAKKVDPSSSLFEDKGTPLKVKPAEVVPEHTLLPTRSSQLKIKKYQAVRRKYPAGTIVKKLGASEDVDPLGTASASAQSEPARAASPESKNEQLVQEANAPLYNIKNETEGEREEALRTQTTFSKPAAEETAPGLDLEITVGDPVKVGDITTAHIEYSIKTINRNQSPLFPEQSTVARRYRDFRWIYHQLQSNHPGRIIPPPPRKETYIGRFNEALIENRRLSLEKMLTKISKLPYIADDADFVMFLTSDDFINQSKERENASGSRASLQTEEDDDSLSIVTGTGGGSFMSTFFSRSVRPPEPDSYFSQKKVYIEDLEHNLRTYYKSLELIATQRLDIAGVVQEIAATVDELAQLEILKATSELLGAFAEVHMKLKENLERVNLQEQLTLGFTINEYLRIIGSVKHTFETRLNIFQQYHTFTQDLQKKEESLEKAHRTKGSADRVTQLNFEVDKLKQKAAYYEKSFKSISDTIKSEIEKFEMAKIEDFRNSVEIFIEGLIEAQKEAIELWETFYERQNLAHA